MAVVNKVGENCSGLFFPIALGGFLALGNEAATTARINIFSLNLYMSFMLYTVISILVFRLIDKFREDNIVESIPALNKKSAHSNAITSLLKKWITLSYNAKFKDLCVDALRIMTCWLPYLVLLFPGIIRWDTGDQIAQVYGISAFLQQPGQIFDHHPFFDAYAFGYTIKFVQFITGSFKLGVFVFVVFQLFLAALVFSYGFSVFKKYSANERVLSFSASFIKWFPPIPIMYCAMVKDVFHSIFFIWWVILFVQIIFSNFKVCISPKFITALFFSGLLTALTKKTGMYILVVSVIILVFYRLKDHTKIMQKAVVLLCVLIPFGIVSYILPHYAYDRLNIVKDGSQASLAVPIEMLARTAKMYPQDITQEEKDAIESYLLFSWEQIGQQYNPYIADPVTGLGVKDDSKKSDFLKAWVAIGLRHPLTYLSAFITIESGWITFNAVDYLNPSADSKPIYPQLMSAITHTHMNPDTGGKLAKSDWDNPVNRMVNYLYRQLSTTPVISTFFYICLWTLCIPMYIVYDIWRKRETVSWFIITPYIVSILTLGLYSVSLAVNDNSTRYMFHSVVLFPLIICALDAYRHMKRINE